MSSPTFKNKSPSDCNEELLNNVGSFLKFTLDKMTSRTSQALLSIKEAAITF